MESDESALFLLSKAFCLFHVDALSVFESHNKTVFKARFTQFFLVFESLGGALPMGADDLARLAGEEFADPKAAQRWRDRPENSGAELSKTFERTGVVIAQTGYRHPRQRGPATRLYVDPIRHPMPQYSVAKRLQQAGSGPVDVAPLDWEECEPLEGMPWMGVYRLRKSLKRGL